MQVQVVTHSISALLLTIIGCVSSERYVTSDRELASSNANETALEMTCTAVLRSALICFSCQLIVYALKIFGLAPFSFRKSITCNNKISDGMQPFRHSRFGLIYNFSLLVPLLFSTVSRIILSSTNLRSDESAMSNTIFTIITILQEILGCITACLVLTFWGLRQRKAARILNSLFKVTSRLSKFERRSTEKWVVASFIMHLTMNLCMVIAFSTELAGHMGIAEFYWVLLEYLPYIIIFPFGLEYSIVVGFLAWKLQTINQCLRNHLELNSPSSRSGRTNALVFNCDDQPASIRLLRTLRSELVDLCTDVGDFFSFPILFCVTFTFVVLFLSLYYLFETAIEFKVIGWSVGSEFYWILVGTVLFVYPLTSLTLNVTRVGREAGLTPWIVYKLTSTTRKDSEVRVELEQFSLDLQHHNVDVFTAYGLFTLNSTLIPSILGGIATYFIVLLQFRLPSSSSGSQPCDCNCNCTFS